ncbi:S-layer homology domain-containing protein [Brevibacillus borstelensis]|uniref:S-layer homology domain-containing protein n=1 Tax=Brevibacillus borstelensis TaxID=45462 RepID=UPI00046978C3|nr:S-layer homology domain-containing protein [Brevibacillus borstelensis]NOU55908.1 S-layer homology domain-containing protein [Brevibacillus borstelensis]
MKRKASHTITGLLATAAIGTSVLIPVQSAWAAANFADINKAGSYQAAVKTLAEQQVFEGYGADLLKPQQAITRAELAKLAVAAFGLPTGQGSAAFSDVERSDWFHPYVTAAVSAGIMTGDGGQFLPDQPVTVSELVHVVAKANQTERAALQKILGNANSQAQATRAEAAYLVVEAKRTAQQAQQAAENRVTSIEAQNVITLVVKFAEPLPKEEVELEAAKKNFVFDNGLTIRNVPQLMTGTEATYIVPTTVQKEGTTYTLTYKGKQAGTFEANPEKLVLRSTQQVTSDTFEVESSLEDGVTDYGNVIVAYRNSRPNPFALDENNQYNGKTYEILSSMRDISVTITPEGGEPIRAGYVPFTQATDGRQAPKFRLPDGQKLKPGTTYTVTADWATLQKNTFVATEKAPLTIEEVKATDEKTLSVTLAEDPKDELFALRSITLTAPDGTKLTADYKLTSRKGQVGTFELKDGALEAGTTYEVAPVGDWAIADRVRVTLE